MQTGLTEKGGREVWGAGTRAKETHLQAPLGHMVYVPRAIYSHQGGLSALQ